MKIKHFRMSSILICLAVMTLLLITTTNAYAQTVTFTQTFHDVTQSVPSANPCTGAPGTVTITFNGVSHIILDSSTGTGHLTETMTGDFTFVPSDSTQPTITGHFTSHQNMNNNVQNFTTTTIFNLHGTGSDGSQLHGHILMHISVSATGTTIESFNATCN